MSIFGSIFSDGFGVNFCVRFVVKFGVRGLKQAQRALNGIRLEPTGQGGGTNFSLSSVCL